MPPVVLGEIAASGCATTATSNAREHSHKTKNKKKKKKRKRERHSESQQDPNAEAVQPEAAKRHKFSNENDGEIAKDPVPCAVADDNVEENETSDVIRASGQSKKRKKKKKKDRRVKTAPSKVDKEEENEEDPPTKLAVNEREAESVFASP